MKPLWNPCRRRRREISLLAAESLPEPDRRELERHLAACPACRKYYREIKALAAPLASWETHFAQIEPTQAMQARWAAAVQASAAGRDGSPSRPVSGRLGQASLPGEPPLQTLCRNLWRELIWPCRCAWVGIAAIWLALLAVNARLADHQPAGPRSSSAEAMLQSWEEQTRVLAELTQPSMGYSAPAPPPAAPVTPPRPRSERKQQWQIV
jgi:anti-sigma factor RsiW